MNDLLKNKGWTMYYACHCNGSRKEHWSNKDHPEYEITTRPKRSTFRILRKNKLIEGPLFGYKLKETMERNGL